MLCPVLYGYGRSGHEGHRSLGGSYSVSGGPKWLGEGDDVV